MEMQNILGIIFALAIVLITRYLIPYLRAAVENEGQTGLVTLIENLVAAAEQVIVGAKKGEQKKQYVEDILAAQGVKVDSATDAIIEGAVYKLNEKKGA